MAGGVVDWTEPGTARCAFTGFASFWIVIGVVAPVIGAANPWNLVYVDRAFNRPFAGALVVIVALGGLWHLYVRRPWLRWIGWFTLGGVVFLWLVGGCAVLVLNSYGPPSSTLRAQVNDVEALAEGYYNSWDIHLLADRGLWSRENNVVIVGTSASGLPSIEVRFTGPDELVVMSGSTLVYRARFDPHDLDIEHEECRNSQHDRSQWVGCVL